MSDGMRDGRRRTARWLSGGLAAGAVALGAAIWTTPAATGGVAAVGAADAPVVGVYYFAGWQPERWRWSPQAADPWRPIRAFPDRRPLAGWYDGRSDALVARQAAQMTASHIGFMVYDWTYEDGAPQLQGPLEAWRRLRSPHPPFALLWTNHGRHTTAADWAALTRMWTRDYLADRGYFRIDGRPVLFVYSAQRLADDAAAAGGDAGRWLADAQAAAKRAGLPPIYFVGGVVDAYEPIVPRLRDLGFAAVSGYNFRHRPQDRVDATSFAELTDIHRAQWPLLARFAPALPAIVPITSGWDRRAWGGSTDPLRDGAGGDPARFAAELRDARTFMDAKGMRFGVICCWNEYGEGSYIEPTRGRGTAMTDAVRAAF